MDCERGVVQDRKKLTPGGEEEFSRRLGKWCPDLDIPMVYHFVDGQQIGRRKARGGGQAVVALCIAFQGARDSTCAVCCGKMA